MRTWKRQITVKITKWKIYSISLCLSSPPPPAASYNMNSSSSKEIICWFYLRSLLMASIIPTFKSEFTIKKYWKAVISQNLQHKHHSRVRLCLQAHIPRWLSVTYSIELRHSYAQTHSCYRSVWSICAPCWRELRSVFKLRGNKDILHFQNLSPCWSLKSYKNRH